MKKAHENPSESTFAAQEEALRKLARRLAVDENEIDDLVQESWLIALVQPRGRIRNPQAWLARVLRKSDLHVVRTTRKERLIFECIQKNSVRA